MILIGSLMDGFEVEIELKFVRERDVEGWWESEKNVPVSQRTFFAAW